MPDDPIKASKRVLEPQERISEVLFGLIMVLTFTGSLSVATADHAEVRTMLVGALGCNLAWGIIDSVLYLMGCLAEKGRAIRTFRAVRKEMSLKRSIGLIAFFAILAGWNALAQTTTNASVSTTTNASPALTKEATEKLWSFSASVYTYLVPESGDYAQPTVTADRDWLHLEARYNYEALQTGSTWVGYNFSGGETLAWHITPMLGGVFGDTTGIAPGYKGTLAWWKLELYSEGEYVFDSGDWSDSFFYNWSELSLYPLEWFRIGAVTQRTRVYDTDREVQRGFLVGFTYEWASLTTYVFNPDESKPTVVVAVAVSF